ncbi:MAG: DUF368 domain-containing protein [Gammaproteobacteria bacterium]|nr:DUF368 domain-containing protein [Gammaproteobacteria bacterium]
MGVAEIVPGVSGGTIAFITGIYDELVASLASFSHRSLGVLINSGFSGFWRAHNLSFLSILALGMLVSVLAFARLMDYLFVHHALYVWGFFFGLVAASVVNIGVQVRLRWLLTLGLVGVLVGWYVGHLGRDNPDPALIEFFLGGALAILAWMLPGISGSFVLLLLGLYGHVLGAVNLFHFDVLGTLIAGIAVGLLVFSKALAFALRHWREQIIAVLVGFMAGSLVRLWPWRIEADVLSPGGYAALMGGEPLVLGVGVAMLCGAASVLILAMFSRVRDD